MFGDLLEIGFKLNKMKIRVTVGLLDLTLCVSLWIRPWECLMQSTSVTEEH